MIFVDNLKKAIRDKRQTLETYDLMHGRDGSWNVLYAELQYLISLQRYQKEGSFEAQSKLLINERQMLQEYLEYELKTDQEKDPQVREREAAYIRSKINTLDELIKQRKIK